MINPMNQWTIIKNVNKLQNFLMDSLVEMRDK